MSPSQFTELETEIEESNMARRKKTASEDKLNAEEVEKAAPLLMIAAQAHQRAAVCCRSSSDDLVHVVSIQLALLSVEQSLRLLLLLHYSVPRHNVNHNPKVLYQDIRSRSGGKGGIRHDIINQMNVIAQGNGIDPFSEKDLIACLNKHDSSYTNLRYFGLNHQARSNGEWGFTARDMQILHCAALALTHVNMDEMERQSIGVLQPRSVPLSEVPEKVRARLGIKDRN